MKPFFSKPRYGLAEPAGWSIGIGVLCLLALIWLPGAWILILAVAALYLVTGIGAWQEIRGAAVAGMWIFALGALARIVAVIGEFTWARLGSMIFFAWLAWEYRSALKQWDAFNALDEDGFEDVEEDDGPIVSIVLLLKSPRYLEDVILAKLIEEAWGGDYSSGDEEAQDGFVVGETPMLIVKSPHGMFMVHNHPVPYFDDPEAVGEEIGELRLRRAVMEHEAWLSVDLLNPENESESPEAFYPLIIRLIYELAEGDDVLAVLRPETGQINVWDDDVLEALLRPDGLEQFNQVDPHVPVIPVAEDDPAMVAAVDEAKIRWPEFVEAFASRNDEDDFGVKAPITVGENTEFIWVEVTGLEPDYIHGKLGNEPVALEGLTLGSVVEVPVEDLNDWYFSKGETEQPLGLFTVKAVQEAQDRFRAGQDD